MEVEKSGACMGGGVGRHSVVAFFQTRNPGCDESGQGQRGGTQRGWKETQCTTLPPMPSNLTLPCRDQMGQLGLDTRWKFDLRMPSAREPGALSPWRALLLRQ